MRARRRRGLRPLLDPFMAFAAARMMSQAGELGIGLFGTCDGGMPCPSRTIGWEV